MNVNFNDENRALAAKLLREAADKIESSALNFSKSGWQCGGAYWRVARVLGEFLEVELARQETPENCERIKLLHNQKIIAAQVGLAMSADGLLSHFRV